MLNPKPYSIIEPYTWRPGDNCHQDRTAAKAAIQGFWGLGSFPELGLHVRMPKVMGPWYRPLALESLYTYYILTIYPICTLEGP